MLFSPAVPGGHSLWVRDHVFDLVCTAPDREVKSPVAVDARLPDVAAVVVLLGAE